ncbi:hypothetical protein J2Z32_000362 [Paenibacillus turicensis]|uniref:DUF2975 domain-containing protein n=1 Tax=Paenibacillus turicensis TaxID=160487 RepID=A0ABS4FME3_9BACL|nr:DUF2975 domain-containing protein [Paenibacillus turicensis]MBP1903750.1 hypothetical protein [Paenibacillus turicensis]
MRKFMTAKRANELARFLQRTCVLMVGLAVIVFLLVLFGRMQLTLITPQGHFADAMLAEKNHNSDSRFGFTNLSDLQIYLRAIATGGEVQVLTYIGIVIMGFMVIIPGAYAFFLMAIFFGNIAKGNVFTSSNASLLLQGGIVLVACSIITPILNAYIIPPIINKFTSNVISTAVGIDFTQLFAGAILLIMAYVFHYGIYLQDEADHTL